MVLSEEPEEHHVMREAQTTFLNPWLEKSVLVLTKLKNTVQVSTVTAYEENQTFMTPFAIMEIVPSNLLVIQLADLSSFFMMSAKQNSIAGTNAIHPKRIHNKIYVPFPYILAPSLVTN